MSTINYTVSNGKINQNVNPGVFFYFDEVPGSLKGTTVNIVQTQNDAGPLFSPSSVSQVFVFDANCNSISGVTANINNPADVTIGLPNVTPAGGFFVVAVKYSTKSIAGTTAPNINPVTYTFDAEDPLGTVLPGSTQTVQLRLSGT